MDAPQVIPEEILVAIFSVADSDALSDMYRKSSRYQKLLQTPYVLETIAQSNGIPYVVEHTSKGQRIVDYRIKDFYDLILAMRLRENPEQSCLGIVKKLEIAIRDRDPKLFKQLLVDNLGDGKYKIFRLLGEYGDIRLINIYVDIFQHEEYYDALTNIVFWLAAHHHNNLIDELFEKFKYNIEQYEIFNGASVGLNYELISKISDYGRGDFIIEYPLEFLVEAAARTGNKDEVVKALKLNADAGYTLKSVTSELISGYLFGGHLESLKELFENHSEDISSEDLNNRFTELLINPVLESNCGECFDWVVENFGKDRVKSKIIFALKFNQHVPSFLWKVMDEWNDDQFNQKLFDSLLETDDFEDLIKLYNNYNVKFHPRSIEKTNQCFLQWIVSQLPN